MALFTGSSLQFTRRNTRRPETSDSVLHVNRKKTRLLKNEAVWIRCIVTKQMWLILIQVLNNNRIITGHNTKEGHFSLYEYLNLRSSDSLTFICGNPPQIFFCAFATTCSSSLLVYGTVHSARPGWFTSQLLRNGRAEVQNKRLQTKAVYFTLNYLSKLTFTGWGGTPFMQIYGLKHGKREVFFFIYSLYSNDIKIQKGVCLSVCQRNEPRVPWHEIKLTWQKPNTSSEKWPQQHSPC